jgi:hypothetical protein
MAASCSPPAAAPLEERWQVRAKERGGSPSRGVADALNLPGMADAEDRIWIEIDPRSSSIAGSLHHGPDPVRPFHGWLELVSLIEAICAPEPATGELRPTGESP